MRPGRSLIFLLFLVSLVAVAATAQESSPNTVEPAFDRSITVPELFEKAREAFGLEDHVLAELFYQEILRREETNVQAMLELANVYERSGRLEYARGLLSRAAKLSPHNEQIAERRANVDHMLEIVLSEEIDELMAAGNYDQALPKLAMRIEISPDDPDLLYLRSMCLYGLGRYDAALKDVAAAIQIDPQERYYDHRSEIVDRMKRLESTDLKTRVEALVQSGTGEDREEALHLLGEILTASPDDSWARHLFVELSDTAGGTAAIGARQATRPGGWSVPSAGTILNLVATLWGFVDRHLALLLGFSALVIVFRSPLTRTLPRLFVRTPILAGQLDTFSLPEVLLMLNAEPHTGVLEIKGKACRGKVFFESGEPCHSVVGRIEGIDALNHLLDQSDAGHFSFIDGVMPARRSIDAPLSLILFEHARDTGTAPAPGTGGDSHKKSRMKELLDSQRT